MNPMFREFVENVGTLNTWGINKDMFREYLSSEVMVEKIAWELRHHRVINIAIDNLKQHDDRLFDHLIQRIEKIRSPQTVHHYNVEEIQKLLNMDNLLFIKGSAVSQLYPGHLVRGQLDVDVLIPSFDDLGSLLNNIDKKYTYDKLKIYVSHNLELSGSMDIFPVEIDNEAMPIIDIHIGTFPIWGATKFNGNLWEGKININGAYIPSWENNLLLIVAHVTTQWFYRLRDINDIFLLLTRVGNTLDWDYVIRTSKSEHIFDILVLLIQETERIYNTNIVPINVVELIGRTKPHFILNLFRRKSWGKFNPAIGFLMQTKYLLCRYPENLNPFLSFYHSMKNGINMILYKNRAYSAHSRRKIRKIKPNEILVLVPLQKSGFRYEKFGEGISLPPYDIRVMNQGTWREHFITPYGIWVQANYRGELALDLKARLKLEIMGG